MSSPRAKDVTFSSDDQACQTMVLDLDPAATNKPAAASGEEATVVLDLSATQIHQLLEDTDVEVNNRRMAGTKPALRR
jgi:hypothetical protein